MAEEEEVVELTSAAPEDVQARAKEMGWIPPERYKGDPERFVDADLFVQRGEEILPIVKARSKQLEGQVGQLTGKVAQLETIIQRNAEAMEALEEYHTAETRRKVEQVRKELKGALARASEAGDHEGVAEATDQLTQLNAKVEETEAKPPKELPPEQAVSPEFQQWAEGTGWFGTDRRKTALAMEIAREFRQAGDTTLGTAFLDKVAAEVEATLGTRRQPPTSDKVAGAGRPGGGRPSGGKSYNDLPPEAKQECDGFAKQLVGEGRRHKDLASWRAKYAQSYFEEA